MEFFLLIIYLQMRCTFSSTLFFFWFFFAVTFYIPIARWLLTIQSKIFDLTFPRNWRVRVHTTWQTTLLAVETQKKTVWNSTLNRLGKPEETIAPSAILGILYIQQSAVSASFGQSRNSIISPKIILFAYQNGPHRPSIGKHHHTNQPSSMTYPPGWPDMRIFIVDLNLSKNYFKFFRRNSRPNISHGESYESNLPRVLSAKRIHTWRGRTSPGKLLKMKAK